MNELSSQYQQQNVNTSDNGYTFEELPESMNVSYLSRKGSVAGVTGGVDLKVNTVRKLLKKIWHGRQATYNSRVNSFFDICKKNDWDPDKVLNAGKIKNTKDLDDNDKEVIRLICNPYYRESDENWWNLVRTGAELRRPEKTDAEPVPNIQSSPTGIVEQQDAQTPTVPTGVAVPPQNETVSLDQQPAQPVQQQAQTPEQSQPAQSVFTDQQQPTAQQEQDEHVEQPIKENNQQNDQGIAYNMSLFIRTELLKQDKFKNILNDLLLNKYKQYYKGNANLSVFYLFDNAFKSKNYQPVISVFSDYVNNLENTKFKQDYLKNLVTRLKDYLTRVQQAY